MHSLLRAEGWGATTRHRPLLAWWNLFVVQVNKSNDYNVNLMSGNNKMRYILRVMALLEPLWRHQQWSASCPPSWILPRIGNQVETARNREMVIFFVLYMKNKTLISTLYDFSYKICLYCRKKLKKRVSSPKNGLATCYLWLHIL